MLIKGDGPQEIENDSFSGEVVDYVHVNKVLGIFRREKTPTSANRIEQPLGRWLSFEGIQRQPFCITWAINMG